MFTQLTAQLSKGRSLDVSGLRGGATAYLIGKLTSLAKPLLCLAPNESLAQQLSQDLALFSSVPCLHYPGFEIPPYTPLSPDSRTVAERLATLYEVDNATKPFIMVASAEALLRRVLSKEDLSRLADLVMTGEDVDTESLVTNLSSAGYESAALVQTVGEYSVRGGIIDIFPPGFDLPIRLDFFGDTIDSIRTFDPISQRSVDTIDEAVLLPVRDVLFPAEQDKLTELSQKFTDLAEKQEWDEDASDRICERLENRQYFPGIEFFLPLFSDKTATPLDFLPKETLIVFLSPMEVAKSSAICRERMEANFAEACTQSLPAFAPDALFLPEEDLEKQLTSFQHLRFHDFAHLDMDEEKSIAITSSNHSLLKQNIELARRKTGLLPELANQVRQWLEVGDKVAMACRSSKHAEHMVELFQEHHLQTTLNAAPLTSEYTAGCINLFDQPLSNGFDLPDEQLHWLSESQLFGQQRLGAKKKTARKKERPSVRFEELHPGDFIVHKAHGVGMFEGLINLELNNIANDFVTIMYRDEDKLYVPVAQLNVISKYKGISDTTPKLDKLGSKAWQNKRKKVKEAVWQVAHDLLNLYAKRSLAKGQQFAAPDEMYRELEESFPFDETSGQLAAINDVLDDLTSDRPMDRLVCGDVGYGKTEVAIRAAFKVLADNFQVAILVPTTVLAEQHAETFRTRLDGFPVRIESLTRFRTTSEQKETIKDLAAGRVDIIIGTHRLLSKDINFKKLGLLIIDEEHRFGVTHKEKLKEMRSQVDVMTLTATPIPRTLQFSLLGIRDLSVISSPPEHRRPVKTFVARHDELVIKEGITRELQRGGQVFLVHNRVRSIHEVAATIQKLVPEARLAVAHGQMPGKDLEEIMVKFVRNEVDVLICTTIIESGLDIQNANTIIITRADRLGLAEIYQLRGRVGRGRSQAYAYLLVPSLDGLSKDARQRLRALMDYNELGGGFKLAMSDLQIRGGGNILGESQSGNINAVGYDLYLELLQQTVHDLKRKAAKGEEVSSFDIEPEINLQLSAYIPEHFIKDTNQRYVAYRRITSMDTIEGLMDLQDEFKDRYGAMPQESINLFEIVALRGLLKKAHITKLEQGPKNLTISFHETTPVGPEIILELISTNKNGARFTPDSRLIFPIPNNLPQSQIIQEAQNLIQSFLKDDN